MSDAADIITFVGNAQAVIAKFGRWPSFHDAEVLRLELNRVGPNVTMAIRVFDMTGEVGERGHFRLENECVVVLRFAGVAELEMFDFNEQNALSAMTLERFDGEIRVKLQAAYGVACSFSCDRIEVTAVEPFVAEAEL